MTAYALRLANGMDTAPRCRAVDALGLTPAGPLQARNGLRPDGGGEVTVVEGTMAVDVSPFMGWVDGDTSDAQGGYPFVSDDTAQLTLTDGDPGDDRTDTIVARVQDAAYDGGGVTAATVEVVPGVPGAGAPALPPTCIPLRDVLVPAGLSAGSGGLSASNLGSDRRTYTAAAGGVVNVTGVADRDAMVTTEGQVVWRRDVKRLETFDGAEWVSPDRPAHLFVRRVATQSLPTNSTTAIVFDTVEESDGFTYSAPSASVTVPADGVYDVHGAIATAIQGTGQLLHYTLQVDGSSVAVLHRGGASPNQPSVMGRSKRLRLNAGQTVGLAVFHNTGATETTYDGSGQYRTELQISRVHA